MLEVIGAALGSLGFACLFNIRGDKLIVAAFIGGVGGFVDILMMNLGYSAAWALFFASISISIFAEVFARVFKCPVTTFLICALIPLVPGGGMYYTMLEVVQNNLDGALIKGIDTITQACSIALGCILVSSITRMYTQNKNRLIKRRNHESS